MRWECRERFPRHRLQRKQLISDPGMHHGTCVTHVPWCLSGSLTRGGRENVPGIPGACATRNFTYLVRGALFPNSLESLTNMGQNRNRAHFLQLQWTLDCSSSLQALERECPNMSQDSRVQGCRLWLHLYSWWQIVHSYGSSSYALDTDQPVKSVQYSMPCTEHHRVDSLSLKNHCNTNYHW